MVQAFVRTAAAVLSATALAGVAWAQAPRARTIDTSPPPAEERSSVGAIVLVNEPVLAHRAYMQQLPGQGPDARSMGAGPAQVLRRMQVREELEAQRVFEALEFQRRGAGALTGR